MEYEKSLPQSELEIMKALWKIGEPISAAKLNVYMNKGWRVQTLITHLARMVAKKAVICQHIPSGRGARYFYSPAISKTDYVNREMGAFIYRLYDDDPKSFMDSLYACGKIQRADVEYLAEKF